MKEAWEAQCPSSPAAFVLLALADHARDSNRQAWPGQRKLVALCRLSFKGLSLQLDKLEKWGHITSEKKRGIRTGKYTVHPQASVPGLELKKGKLRGFKKVLHAVEQIQPNGVEQLALHPVEQSCSLEENALLHGVHVDCSTGCAQVLHRVETIPYEPLIEPLVPVTATAAPVVFDSEKRADPVPENPPPQKSKLKAKRAKPAAPADPRHQDFIDEYFTAWNEAHPGAKYDVQQRDVKAVKDFLKRNPDKTVEELKERLLDCWEHIAAEGQRADFIPKQSVTIFGFLSRYNEITSYLMSYRTPKRTR